MEQKKYTLAEAAKILGEMFINMANSLEVNEETCSPECEKRCLGECGGGDKCQKHHNDSTDAMVYAMKAFDKINNEKQEYYEMIGNLRADLDSTHQYIENFCKKESDSNSDKDVKEDLTKCCEEKKEDFVKKISAYPDEDKEALRKYYEQQKETFCKKASNISKDEELELVKDLLNSSVSCFKVPVRFIFGTSGIDEDTKSLLKIAEEEAVVQLVNDVKRNFIKKLSEETGHGLIKCKRVLVECDYDYDKAKQYLMKDKFGTSY